MAVRRPFILSLYGVAGVLIEYSAHNCRCFDFRPFGTLFLAILGHMFYPNSTRKTFREFQIPLSCITLNFLSDRLCFITPYYGLHGVNIRKTWFIPQKWWKWAKITTLWRHNDVKIYFFEETNFGQHFWQKYSYGIGYVIFCTFEVTWVKTAKNSYLLWFSHISYIKSLPRDKFQFFCIPGMFHPPLALFLLA